LFSSLQICVFAPWDTKEICVFAICGFFITNLQIYDLRTGTPKNLRICDCGMTQEFADLRSVYQENKFACVLLNENLENQMREEWGSANWTHASYTCINRSLICRMKEKQRREGELGEWQLDTPYATEPDWHIRLGRQFLCFGPVSLKSM
jgi:hypothetical protein